MIYKVDANDDIIERIERDNAARRERAQALSQRRAAQAQQDIDLGHILRTVEQNQRLIIALGATVEQLLHQRAAQ